MNYKISGTPISPVLIFSNSLGSEMMMWDELVPYLLPYFRVLQYNTRGHGDSDGFNQSNPKSIKTLARDVLRMMDEQNIEKAYFCGLSMGGLIGQYLAIHHADRFIKIVLSNTAAQIGTVERWNERIENIQKNGMEAIVADTMLRWFTADFLQKKANIVTEAKSMFLRNNINGYAACCEAIRDADFRTQLNKIKIETLIIAGEEDPVTNVDHAKFLNVNIANSKLEILPAKHLSAMECPQKYAEILIKFCVGSTNFDRGMHVRRSVLGDTHVNNSIHKTNEFNADFQAFITNYAWGEIWTRPGLSKHQKSLITLSMLIALNRPAEFKMHVKAAFNNGVSKDEIKEVIMQSAIYCGLPAANDAFHLAQDVFSEIF